MGGPPAITVALVDASNATKKGLLVVVARELSQPKLIPENINRVSINTGKPKFEHIFTKKKSIMATIQKKM